MPLGHVCEGEDGGTCPHGVGQACGSSALLHPPGPAAARVPLWYGAGDGAMGYRGEERGGGCNISVPGPRPALKPPHRRVAARPRLGSNSPSLPSSLVPSPLCGNSFLGVHRRAGCERARAKQNRGLFTPTLTRTHPHTPTHTHTHNCVEVSRPCCAHRFTAAGSSPHPPFPRRHPRTRPGRREHDTS